MADANMVQTMIASVGFPIVAVIGLAWFIHKAFERFTTQNERREEKLYAVIEAAQTTNKELTETNSKFVAVLHAYASDLDEIKNDVSEIKTNLKG